MEFNVPFQHKYGYIRDEKSAGAIQHKCEIKCNLHNISPLKQSTLYGPLVTTTTGVIVVKFCKTVELIKLIYTTVILI